MRAAVIIPPIEDFYFTPHRLSTLGAKVVCKILSDRDISVTFFNFPSLAERASRIPLPPELMYLESFLIENETGKLSFFKAYQRLGPSLHECARQVCDQCPDICLISCFAFCYAHQVLELAAELKKRQPGLRIIAGGAGVSVHPLYFINDPAVDFVLVGEAEVCLAKFLEVLHAPHPSLSDVSNLFMKQDGAVIKPRHIKFTAADDLYVVWGQTRERGEEIFLSTSISRGCPKRCRFCSVGLYHGRSFRIPPVERVIEGLLSFLENGDCLKGNLRINFEDDNLLLEPGYFLDLLQRIKDSVGHVSFYAENGIDYMLLTPRITNKLIDAGMRQFNLSLASTDLTVLRKQGRRLDLERYEGILRSLSLQSIPSITYFICGFQEDTKETIAQNLAYLAHQDTLLGISLFYPIPGITGYNSDCPGNGISPRLSAGSSAYPWSGSLSTSTLVTAFRLSRYVNLLKNRHKTDEEHGLCDRIGSTQRLHTIIKEKGDVRIIEVPNTDKELVSLFFQAIKKGERG